MANLIGKREFLAAGTGLGLGLGISSAFAQGAPAAAAAPRPRRQVPHRMAKTTKLFKSPPGFPNALAVAPEGLWIGQQKLSGASAAQYHLPDPTDLTEHAWLVDWNGKLLKTVATQSRNTSGMAYGDGYVWMMANETPEGAFQVDMNSKQISHRQIPLGIGSDGGGCHGAQWHDGKLWIVANRLHSLMRVDPKTWTPEVMIPINTPEDRSRYHDITFDNDGNIWQVTGNDSKSYAEGKPGLVKYDGKTGAVLMTVDFEPGSCDPHGLENHNGTLVSCDAGIHPGWPNSDSPSSGYIFRIDLV
jgi:hypothetical protein